MASLLGSTPAQWRFSHARNIEITAASSNQFCNGATDGTAIGETILLSKRVAELGLCKLGEAERILEEASNYSRTYDKESLAAMKKIIYLRGHPMVRSTNTLVPVDEKDIELHSGMPIRLSKRMSELGICSRREAARILKEASECNDASSLKHLKEVIFLKGKPVMDGAAVKVHPGEKYIQIRAGDDPPVETNDPEGFLHVPYADRPWNEIHGDTIVLNKPAGYVSGQEEHQHVPAVRLLTRDNMHLDDFDEQAQQTFRNGAALYFDRWKFAGYDMKANSIPKHIRDRLDDEQLREESKDTVETLSGYAPAGRLDIDSTGLILFTRAGIMARRLIEPKSKIPKEYIVKVQPVIKPTAREIEMGLTSLPSPTDDLSVLVRKRNRLFGELKPCKRLLLAEWLDDEQTEEDWEKRVKTMRLVLLEGKKRQIRRMCREILGWHVVELVRTSVGTLKMGSLPEGKWRPLTQEEAKSMFDDHSDFRNGRDPLSGEELEIASNIVNSQVLTKKLPDPPDVMRAIKRALMKDPERKLPMSKLRKKVQKRLRIDAKEEGMRDKWRRHLKEIIDANLKVLELREVNTVVLRRWDDSES